MNIQKHREFILYIFFGGITTAVNYIAFFSISHIAAAPYWLSSAIAWLAAVLTAYITNRKFVFKASGRILKELPLFVAARLVSGIITAIIVLIFVDILLFNALLIFTICQIFVIIFNYLISRKVVFPNQNRGIL